MADGANSLEGCNLEPLSKRLTHCAGGGVILYRATPEHLFKDACRKVTLTFSWNQHRKCFSGRDINNTRKRKRRSVKPRFIAAVYNWNRYTTFIQSQIMKTISKGLNWWTVIHAADQNKGINARNECHHERTLFVDCFLWLCHAYFLDKTFEANFAIARRVSQEWQRIWRILEVVIKAQTNDKIQPVWNQHRSYWFRHLVISYACASEHFFFRSYMQWTICTLHSNRFPALVLKCVCKMKTTTNTSFGGADQCKN